ncbi:MAG: class I SAM-dependent methyltransferase [Pseudomonadota bacterium]
MADFFGPDVACRYDRDHCNQTDEEVRKTVEFLAEFAGSGHALEFAIGTGRVALPLSDSGIKVSGIELSEAMVGELRRKLGGNEIPVAMGDMAQTRIEGRFSLVYLVFNTLSNLTSQDAQVACFRNAAAHLEDGGYFVVENAIPRFGGLANDTTKMAFDRSDNHWGIDEIDVVTQRGTSHHVWLEETGPKLMALPFRFVWPSEMDLMAALAGLKLVERWQDWWRTPLTAESKAHVSVWRKH